MASYKNLEEVLKEINAKYISLNTEQVRHNNELLRATLKKMIRVMREQDSTFKTIYKEPFFGGSYYDDLKVGKPDEFDLDLLLAVPTLCEIHRTKSCDCLAVIPSDKPGFLWFIMKEDHYKPFNNFIKDGYMRTDLILNWMKSLITKTLNSFIQNDSVVDGFYFYTPKYQSESGPALTLRLSGKFGSMDIDLVPAFKFGSSHWPQIPYRQNSSTKRSHFLIVPKKAKGVAYGERYWRCSFQDHERDLINGRQRLKPALRLLKKMRNNLIHKSISSYALKTLTLWELELEGSYWEQSLSEVFMKLLKKYHQNLSKNCIDYYWNQECNLLDNIHPDTLFNHCNEIANAIKKIDQYHAADPLIIAKVILKEKSEDYKLFIDEYDRGETPEQQGFGDMPSPTQELIGDSTGWSIAGLIIGVGAALLGAAAVFGAVNRNNRNQNN